MINKISGLVFDILDTPLFFSFKNFTYVYIYVQKQKKLFWFSSKTI